MLLYSLVRRTALSSFLSTPHACRRFSGISYRIGIVGSGPAGFYTAQRILKLNPQVKVDIIERLPAPFGLVR